MKEHVTIHGFEKICSFQEQRLIFNTNPEQLRQTVDAQQKQIEILLRTNADLIAQNNQIMQQLTSVLNKSHMPQFRNGQMVPPSAITQRSGYSTPTYRPTQHPMPQTAPIYNAQRLMQNKFPLARQRRMPVNKVWANRFDPSVVGPSTGGAKAFNDANAQAFVRGLDNGTAPQNMYSIKNYHPRRTFALKNTPSYMNPNKTVAMKNSSNTREVNEEGRISEVFSKNRRVQSALERGIYGEQKNFRPNDEFRNKSSEELIQRAENKIITIPASSSRFLRVNMIYPGTRTVMIDTTKITDRSRDFGGGVYTRLNDNNEIQMQCLIAGEYQVYSMDDARGKNSRIVAHETFNVATKK